MNGGPSQMDTFDLKPGHANGGPFKEIATSVPGIKISEHLPKLAKHMDQHGHRPLDDHQGRRPRPGHLPAAHRLPAAGADPVPDARLAASPRSWATTTPTLPNFVSIAPFRFFSPAAYGPGFLGPQYAPLVVGEQRRLPAAARTTYDQALKVQDLRPPGGRQPRPRPTPASTCCTTWSSDFVASHPGVAAAEPPDRLRPGRPADAHRRRPRRSTCDEEPAALRDAYGRNLFGQGCLLARRLVERGVPFVEVTLGGVDDGLGWDTHGDNFDAGQDAERRARPGLGHADGRPEGARPARHRR